MMKKSKLFINGGGSLIQDNTSTRSLIYYLAMIWLAKKQGMKVMIYANGIGPLNRERNRKLTGKIVDRVDVITLRENLSYNELKNLKINKPEIMVTADPALTINPESVEHINQLFLNEEIDPHQQFIGISVRKWVNHEKYEGVIAETADYIVDKYGITPLFIAMHYPEDLAIIDNIISKMKNKSCVIRKKPSVSEMLGIIAKTQMLIGMRLHALIFAASLGIPIVGMVYEPKVEGFMQYVGQVSAGNINSLETESLKKIIDEVWNNRDSIKENLDKNIAFLKDKAFENARIAMDLIDGTTH
jgi:polysaccharide pyruvyl transferase CsaB